MGTLLTGSAESGLLPGADEFLPALILLVKRANPPNVHSCLEFIQVQLCSYSPVEPVSRHGKPDARFKYKPRVRLFKITWRKGWGQLGLVCGLSQDGNFIPITEKHIPGVPAL